jgi:NAD(P)-dependent dehydrogenase (short-subunit alcohol dehydrogenase family)
MGRRILVTGARRGIGAALAVGLASPDSTVLVHHLDFPDEAGHVAGEIRALGARATLLEADLADAAAVRDLAVAAGEVDILVNNAARASNVDLDGLPLAEWEQTFAVNVTAPMLLIQALAPGMAARGWGRIVNVVSVTARLGGPSGITVNALSPGAVRTEGEVELAGGETAGLHAEIVAAQAIPRGLLPADMVAAVRFLASDGASGMTGQVLEVGGGLVFR